MARKRAAQQKPEIEPRQSGIKSVSEDAEARIALTGADVAPVFYVNHVEVAHNQHEFEFLFARLPGRLSPEQREELKEAGVVNVETALRLLIPPTLMPALIEVLTIQQGKYATKFGQRQKAPGEGNE